MKRYLFVAWLLGSFLWLAGWTPWPAPTFRLGNVVVME